MIKLYFWICGLQKEKGLGIESGKEIAFGRSEKEEVSSKDALYFSTMS